MEIRPAIAAGSFYPAAASSLRAAVDATLAGPVTGPQGNLRALVVPHAGYAYSGSVAGRAFGVLATSGRDVTTVYLLGPPHRLPVGGVGLTLVDAFATPLGAVPVDREAVTGLLRHGRPFVRAEQAHQPEHCLEVELPFLQVVLPAARIVPLLLDRAVPDEVAAHLADRLDESTLLLVSTDLSHDHPYEAACRLDRALLDALVAGDRGRVAMGEACGRAALLVAMCLAERLGWSAQVLDYRNSGDTAGPRERVVGYAAVAYTT